MFISAFSLLVMKHLSSLEYILNLTTSALWVPCVLESIKYSTSLDFGVSSEYLLLVLAWLGFASIAVGIVGFYLRQNFQYAKSNRVTQEVKPVASKMEPFLFEEIIKIPVPVSRTNILLLRHS